MKKIINTEKNNPASANIDLLDSKGIVEIISREDKTVALAVEKVLEDIAKAVDLISKAFLNRGNLLYFGAGTSGRLGILDASECPPTFSTAPDLVRGYIAGGDAAIKSSVEGAEDSFENGETDLINSGATVNDVVVAISASGNARYLEGVLSSAKNKNISTVGIVCNPQAKIKHLCDIFICTETGAEVITGSTRMKAGTAQKMVLNMLTSASMILCGKTYKNYMIDLNPLNSKLKDRAVRIVAEITETDYFTAENYLINSEYNIKTAIIMCITGKTKEEAKEILVYNSGRLRQTIANYSEKFNEN